MGLRAGRASRGLRIERPVSTLPGLDGRSESVKGAEIATNIRRTLLSVLLAVFATLVLTEASLQSVALAGRRSERMRQVPFGRGPLADPLGALYAATCGPFLWERYFVENFESGVLVYEGLHRSHPTRGWTLAPDLDVRRHGAHYTTNAAGFRSLDEAVIDPARYGILIVGDSFTFGDGIDDTATWPYQLGLRDARFNVFNLAVSGYGVGQMYVTLREEIDHYLPQLVIGAFIGEDLHRSLLPFRDFKKPRLRLEDQRLKLTNVPIGDPEAVYEEARARVDENHSPIQLVNVAHWLWRQLLGPEVDDRVERACSGECATLNTRLFEEMSSLAKDRGADFLLIYLPWGPRIQSDSEPERGEEFFETFQRTHRGAGLDPRAALLRAPFAKAPGHYREPENRVVSRLVANAIRGLPSWRRFETSAQ